MATTRRHETFVYIFCTARERRPVLVPSADHCGQRSVCLSACHQRCCEVPSDLSNWLCFPSFPSCPVPTLPASGFPECPGTGGRGWGLWLTTSGGFRAIEASVYLCITSQTRGFVSWGRQYVNQLLISSRGKFMCLWLQGQHPT